MTFADPVPTSISGMNVNMRRFVPPWTRELLHPMIVRFASIAPTWLLFDGDWSMTVQARPYLPICSHIVRVGRVKWFGNMTGMEDSAWYRFDARHTGITQFCNFDWMTQ